LIPAPRDLSDRFINMDQVSTQPIQNRQVAMTTEAGQRPYPGSSQYDHAQQQPVGSGSSDRQ